MYEVHEGPAVIEHHVCLRPRLHDAVHLGDRSLERVTSGDDAVRNHRLFDVEELAGLALHPPIQRFLARWQPGDPTVYLGSLWAP